MFFVGVDLAWSDKNTSGVAVLEGNEKGAKLVSSGVLHTDDEIINFINKNIKNQLALISIDAPLIVPNKTGRRPAEDLTSLLFRKYDAAPYPANREWLCKWSDTIRGEELSKQLEKIGFKHSPEIIQFEKTRKFFEVYPHPSMVVLFGLPRIFQYKNKQNRDYDFIWEEFKKYQKSLKSLKNLSIPNKIIDKDVTQLKGSALKEYEDLLDGVFCGYIAYYVWLHPEKCAVLGDMKRGYILTPVTDEMQKRLEDLRTQTSLVDLK